MPKSKQKICAFDLETIINPFAVPLLPEPEPDKRMSVGGKKYLADMAKKKQAQIDTMSRKPPYNLICAASWYGNKSDQDSGYIILKDEQSEKELLNELWGVLAGYDYFISFNGVNFDVPSMTLHSMRHRVRPTVQISTSKYSSHTNNHLDCYNILSDFGKIKGLDMDFCLKYFGLADEGKGDMDGSQVQGYWDEGFKEEIGEYCLKDSKRTFEMGQLIMEYLI